MKKKRCGKLKKAVALLLTGAMLCGEGAAFGPLGDGFGAAKVSAADEETPKVTVTSMEYYPNEGPTITRDAVKDATFGFVAPKFNGKEYKDLDLAAVWDDLTIEEKQEDGTWMNIDKKYNPDSPYVWNADWAFCLGENWDNYVFWFKLEESMDLRIRSKTNVNVSLEYHLVVNKLEKKKITSISSSETQQAAEPTGESAIHFDKMTVNGEGLKSFVNYQQYEDDLEMLVDNKDGKGFVALSANPDSNFIWDQNFGMWYDGAGGIWFRSVNWSFTVRFRSRSDNSVYHDFEMLYEPPKRSSFKLSTTGSADAVETNVTAINAEHSGATGIVLPYIDGTRPYQQDLEKFVYQIQVDGNWVDLADPAASGFVYQGNGYSKYSPNDQWGYSVDYVYGLWFQQVKVDKVVRVGYPENGEVGGAVGDNWITYNITGDPDAKDRDIEDMIPIEVDDPEGEPKNDVQEKDIPVPEGWQMIWHDEFNGGSLDSSKWANQTGYILDLDDITTAGWGNNEDEWYSDSPKNTSVHDGMLNITMVPEEKTFTANDGQTATAKYSSGKILTKDKFSVKYGRVDFRAKLPAGTGIWPAMWMMPNDDVYGTWSASGEIDVFEGKGRTPQMAYGTLHYGGVSPGNKNTGDFIDMVANGNKKTEFTDWHVYSVVWEEGNIKVYADGLPYFKCTSEIFYSVNGNENAPFDQRFYLIINLAAGGWFDGGVKPGPDFERADMYVDYVRVFQKEVAEGEDEKNDDDKWESNGKNDGLYGDYKMVGSSSYTVNYYLQNVARNGYELNDTRKESGKAGETVKVNPIDRTGFTYNASRSTASGTVAEDGSLTLNIYYDRNVYNIKYELNGGKDNPSSNRLTYVYGEGIPELASPKKDGFVFDGWYEDEACTDKKITQITRSRTGDITLYAKWREQSSGEKTAEYTILFYEQNTQKNGYRLADRSVETGTVGETVTAKQTERTGFTLNPSAVGSKLSGTVTEDNMMELSLYYDRNTYNITYELDGGTNNSLNAATYLYGLIMQLEEPSKDGYIFAGWFEDAAHTTRIRSIYPGVSGDITVYAAWQEEEKPGAVRHSITYVVNGGVRPSSLINYYEEGVGRVLGEPTYEGREFLGWYTTETFEEGTKITEIPATATTDYVLFAKWSDPEPDVIMHNITYVVYGETQWKGTFEEGKEMRLMQPTREGYTFLGWYTTPDFIAGTGISRISATQKEDITVYARWSKNEEPKDPENYTVTFNSAGGSAVPSQTVEEGKTAIQPAAPTRAGFVFKGWMLGNAAYNFASPVNGNITLTAKWEAVKPPVASVKVTGIKISGISKKIAAGKKVQLTAAVLPVNATDPSVTWSIKADKNAKYASVDAKTGLVRTKKSGKNKTITIIATANDGSGVKAEYKIKLMQKAVKKITLKASATTVKAGKKVRIRATVTPKASAKKINSKLKWESSNPKYATVTSKGLVKTKKAGKKKTVKITARATDGSNKKKTIKIKLK